jgi:hypothetical protein
LVADTTLWAAASLFTVVQVPANRSTTRPPKKKTVATIRQAMPEMSRPYSTA